MPSVNFANMPNHKIKFGTDGWRGVIADDFTFDNLRRVAQATADYWNRQPSPDPSGQRRALVGYDNRFLSETYARIASEVLAANGIQALYPPASSPTPAVTHAVRVQRLCGAIMITASHNPPIFNGFKIKADFAGPADPATCAQIESCLDASPVRTAPFDDALRNGAIQLHDPCRDHLRDIKKFVNLSLIRKSKLRVVIDSMHGSGGRVLENLLNRSGARIQVRSIRADRHPLFGGSNPEPIGKNLGPLCEAVRRYRAHIGLATDGDADRVGIVDNQGRYVSIQIVFALLLLHLIQRGKQPPTGTVVRSINCSVLIDRICRHYQLPLIEVPVGFKHICAEMRARDVLIGGEESGGIGFRGHIPERDGILANLLLLEMLASTGKSFRQLKDQLEHTFGSSAYDRMDIHFPLDQREPFVASLRATAPPSLLGVPMADINHRDGIKFIARDGSWLMLRGSGTEPVFRIYSEAPTAGRVKKLLAHGHDLARRFLQTRR